MGDLLNVVLDAPGIKLLAEQLAAVLRQDADLRAVQAQNAPIAKYPDDQTGAGVTGNTIYTITQATQNQIESFNALQVTFASGSGSGRYTIDGTTPTPTRGVPIPAGGVVLNIVGNTNIQRFQMIAEAGQTLLFFRYLFV